MTKQSRNSNGNRPRAVSAARKSRALRVRIAPLVSSESASGPVLITGGAGFIGTNVARHFLDLGEPVVLLDNLSRPGVDRNVAWLRERYGSLVQVEVADIRDYERVREVIRGVRRVFHFAAQVAVTTSLDSPLDDFEVNARGTLNLLEALRGLADPPPLIFTSTNKVYGDLNDVELHESVARYEPAEENLRLSGFNELRPLDFHSPYGCSKGAADQYVLEYARTFRLPAVVFRMSCVYGPHQCGTEDQGWVAHFLIHALDGHPITVYGDGKQVRDILYVDDLVDAFLLAHQHIDRITGQAFNLGGGPRNTISLLELIDLIEELRGVRPLTRFDQWRPADQQYYVSDVRKFRAATGWVPKVDVGDGVAKLCEWLHGARSAPELPMLVRTPGIIAPAEHRDDAESDGKLRANGAALRGREPRSKRIWRLAGAESAPLKGKIIKFP